MPKVYVSAVLPVPADRVWAQIRDFAGIAGWHPGIGSGEMEDGSAGGLPTKRDEEFRPFIRRLPEFKFWHGATRAIAISFLCSWFEIFNLPVFWPVLVVYWLILFGLTSES